MNATRFDTPTQIRAIIRRRVPSQNKSTYAHWSAYAKEKRAWAILLRAAFTPKPPPEHQVRMRIVSYRVRLCDYANLVGGAKPIPDILKSLGWIKDDAPQWFVCEYVQHKCPRSEERTVIEIFNP